MIENLHSIILKTVKYGDSKLIVDLLTRDRGRMSVVWRMPRSGKGRVNRNLFQPLTICDLQVEGKNRTQLPVVKDAHIAVPYISLNVDPVKMSVVFFLAEFLVQVSRDEQSDIRFFDFVESNLQWYDLADAMTANFHLMFLVRVSHFLGFFPNMESFQRGYVFDLRSAEFCGAVPLHRDFLPADESERLAMLMRMTPANMHHYRFTRDERNHTVEMMLRFYAIHLPGFREMKSWEVLKEVFR